jgi:hypothetical protein
MFLFTSSDGWCLSVSGDWTLPEYNTLPCPATPLPNIDAAPPKPLANTTSNPKKFVMLLLFNCPSPPTSISTGPMKKRQGKLVTRPCQHDASIPEPALAGETTGDLCGLLVFVVLVIDGARRGFSNCTVSPASSPNHQAFWLRLTTPVASPTETSHGVDGPPLAAVGREAGLADARPAIQQSVGSRATWARLASGRVPEGG